LRHFRAAPREKRLKTPMNARTQTPGPIRSILKLLTKGAPMAAAKVPTVSLKQISSKMAEDSETSKKDMAATLDTFIAAVTKHISKGTKVRIPGLGIFSVRKRAARMGRNPATGEAIKIKASKKVAFRAAKELKESL
jgi:DNA-binding protein HU-beta